MSEQDTFQVIKENYRNDTFATAKQYMSLHALVLQEERTYNPRLAKDAQTLAIFDLAIADLKVNTDQYAARILYDDAMHNIQAARTAGGNTTAVDDIARQIGRKI
jgi:hypothetical protein